MWNEPQPIEDADEDADDLLPPPASRPAAKVLVAEDDDDLRDLVVTVLRLAGYDVHEAGNGHEMLDWLRIAAVEEWPNEPYDLVVTDVRMPGASGLDLVAALRARGNGMPVLVVTAFPDAEVAARCRALDATLLAKPFPVRAVTDAALALILQRDRH